MHNYRVKAKFPILEDILTLDLHKNGHQQLHLLSKITTIEDKICQTCSGVLPCCTWHMPASVTHNCPDVTIRLLCASKLAFPLLGRITVTDDGICSVFSDLLPCCTLPKHASITQLRCHYVRLLCASALTLPLLGRSTATGDGICSTFSDMLPCMLNTA
jgi:hypothetical protein